MNPRQFHATMRPTPSRHSGLSGGDGGCFAEMSTAVFVEPAHSNAFGFRNGVTAQGPVGGQGASGDNLVIVKYGSDGTAQWARSVAGPSSSAFESVAVDSAGNVYAVGTVDGSGSYGFGNGQVVAGPFGGGSNAVLVRYSASGDTQWVKSLTSAVDESEFLSVAVDSANNVFVGGDVSQTIAKQ